MPPQAPVERDPEFRPLVPVRQLVEDLEPGFYHRIVANPFLGLLGILAWFGTLSALLHAGFDHVIVPVLVALVLLSALGLPWLFQYHCLDCGKTGSLRLWRRHICPRVAERHFAGRPRRFRGPPPSVQVVLWLYVLLMILLALNALGWTLSWLRRP
ncbi:MAG TPA: hypothetical protein VF590_08810 [Isosphaeraceae bacterium]